MNYFQFVGDILHSNISPDAMQINILFRSHPSAQKEQKQLNIVLLIDEK